MICVRDGGVGGNCVVLLHQLARLAADDEEEPRAEGEFPSSPQVWPGLGALYRPDFERLLVDCRGASRAASKMRSRHVAGIVCPRARGRRTDFDELNCTRYDLTFSTGYVHYTGRKSFCRK